MTEKISSQKITLHHYWRSSCSWRVRWALKIKGIPYDTVPVNILTSEQKSPAYLAKNPSGFLPGLEINGKVYGESLAMIDWLEETYPEPSLLPKDPFDRMRVRQLAMIIASGTQPLQNPSVLSYYTEDGEKKKTDAAYWIAKGLRTFQEVRLAGKPGLFSFGNDVTVADLCLIPQIYNALRFDVNMDGLQDLKEIYDRCLKLPACNAAAPHNQEGASA
jgi:maleylacetoacetate isomerase